MGFDQDKILKLYNIHTHGHPTAGENDQTSLNICMCMFRYLKTAVDLFVLDQWICYTSAIASAFSAGRSNMITKYTKIILGLGEWGVSDVANNMYNLVMHYDEMLHYAVEGDVWDEETKQLLPGVTVRCKVAGFEDKITNTDQNGHFYFEPLGDIVSLEFTDNNYVKKSITVYISDYDVPEPCYVQLRRRAAFVHGTVKDVDTGLPIAGAYIGIENDVTQTDAEGKYRLEMDPGRHRIYYSALKYDAKSYNWTFEEDQDIEINMTLKK